MQLNFEDGIGELLRFVFYYGSGVFSPSVFFKYKKIYDSLLHYISRNPKYFKRVKLSHGASYYILSEFYIEHKIGLFSVMMFPVPKENLEVFQALIYLSLCVDKAEFRKYNLVDFLNGANENFVLDNLEPFNDYLEKKTIITFNSRSFQLSSFGQKTLVPSTCKQRFMEKNLIELSNLCLANCSPKETVTPIIASASPLISKDVDDYFNEISNKKQKESINK